METKFKVGDTAFAEVKIVEIDEYEVYAIMGNVKGGSGSLSFCLDGRWLANSTEPCLLRHEDIKPKERVIEVLHCDGKWVRRVMFAVNRWGDAVCYQFAETLEGVDKYKNHERIPVVFQQWRELNPQRESDLSRKAELEKELEEINKRLG